MRPITLAAVLAVTLVACGDDGATGGSNLESAVVDYSDALLGGDADTGYGLLSARCQETIGPDEFAVADSQIAERYGDASMTSYTEDVDRQVGIVTYRYNDSAIDQEDQPWIRDGGGWRNDECA